MRSRSSSRLGAVAITIVLTGCAASAPPLPPDTTSVNRSQTVDLSAFAVEDREMACPQIGTEIKAIDAQMVEDNSRIESNRTKNQVAGYFGSLYLLPLLATEGNDAEKTHIKALYARRDTLVKLATLKRCD